MACDNHFFLLPHKLSTAADNMAFDLMLLEGWPQKSQAIRFRHYGWDGPSWTFGYSQNRNWVGSTLGEPPLGAQIIRRPTGGGIVDHREDWTYALVIPRSHPMCAGNAFWVYEAIHSKISEALSCCDQPAFVTPSVVGKAGAFGSPTLGFYGAEPGDVINAQNGLKIAGAAQKRNRYGLLLQGSLAKSNTANVDWAAFEKKFTELLAGLLDASSAKLDWPVFDPVLQSCFQKRFASDEWNYHRKR